jgi:uncharacterized protein (DUF58 family)
VRRRFSVWLEKRLPRQRSITLDQARIFIVPTWQGSILLLVALLILLLAINFDSALNYALGFWLIAMLWASVHLTYRNLSGLCITGQVGTLVEVGQMAEITLSLSAKRHHNRGVFELIHEQWGVVAVAMTGQTVTVRLPLLAEARGPIMPPRFRIESRFPFGLIVAWSNLKIDVQAWAYPKAQQFDRQLAGGGREDEQDNRSDQFYRAGSEDFHSLRAYVAGDSIHRLHWSSFSRDQLVVKAFTDYQSANECLDWDQFPGLADESRLSALAYFSQALSEQNQAYGLRLPGLALAVDQGPEQLVRVRRGLAEYGYD